MKVGLAVVHVPAKRLESETAALKTAAAGRGVKCFYSVQSSALEGAAADARDAWRKRQQWPQQARSGNNKRKMMAHKMRKRENVCVVMNKAGPAAAAAKAIAAGAAAGWTWAALLRPAAAAAAAAVAAGADHQPDLPKVAASSAVRVRRPSWAGTCT